MLSRDHHTQKIDDIFQIYPVCAILGPRQCGKTTLAGAYTQKFPTTDIHFFDLEHPRDLNALASPALTLDPLQGMIVIDEIQRRPELFPYIRYLCDHSDKKFLILGSASQELIQQSSETLAGRISYMELTPFSFTETKEFPKHWIRGGFPKSYLADTDTQSEMWRQDYIQTFLERDLAMMGFDITPSAMQRIWMMIAHYHGQQLNYSEISQSVDMSDKTIKRYIDILEGTFMIRLLRPWFVNIKKRITKRPKLYIRDSGLFHSLMDISGKILFSHPKIGASWEGYALEEMLRILNPRNAYYWRTEKGEEMDLVYFKGGECFGYEFKYSDAPKVTKSIHIVKKDLNLKRVTIITPGSHRYFLEDDIEVVGLQNFLSTVA